MRAENLDARLLVAPGSHCVPPTTLDFGGELVRFFDTHLRGVETIYEDEKRIHRLS